MMRRNIFPSILLVLLGGKIMKTRLLTYCLLILALLGVTLLGSSQPIAKAGYEFQPVSPVAPNGTGFTYQGFLNQGNSPANGDYDFQFILYDALVGGAQVGSTLSLEDVSVSQGLFTVTLDFGAVFDGTALFLEISVRSGDSSGAYDSLSPRQALTPAPFVMYAADAEQLAGQPASAYQARISEDCAVGSSVRSVNADGTVVCQPPPAQLTNTILDY
jgi:hypothetical protein